MAITWHVPVALAVFFSYVVHPFLLKKVGSAPGRSRNLVLQYFFASLLALTTTVVLNKLGFIDTTILAFKRQYLIVIGLCLINALACYSQWRAVAVNLSITAVSTWADDLIAMLLSCLVLGEWKQIYPISFVGILLSFGSVIIFSFCKTSINNISSLELRKIYFWVAGYSFIWGGLTFAMRFFALQGMRWNEFIPCWYLGSFLGSLVVYLFSSKEERGNISTLRPAVILTSVMALNIVASLTMTYWSKALAPVLITQPIYQIAEMVLPVLVGLLIFKEKQNFRKMGWLALVMGLVGGLLIAFSF